MGNTGTYLDTPFSRYEDGADVAEMALDHLVHVPGVVVDAAHLDGLELAGRALLVRSSCDRRWKTPGYDEPGPYLTAAAARRLVDAGIYLLGVDCMNIDDMHDLSRPVHSPLLRAGIPHVENLCNLDQLPASGFFIHAAPAPVRGTGLFPVRAYALVP